MAKHKRWAFMKELKAQAVRIVRESGRSVGTAARARIVIFAATSLSPVSLPLAGISLSLFGNGSRVARTVPGSRQFSEKGNGATLV